MRGLLLMAGLGLVQPAWANGGLPINVVQVLDLSGLNGDTGKDFVAGARTCFDHVNSRGGINGRKINLVLADDRGNPAQTVALTRQLVAEARPAALFGYLGADNVDAVMRDLQAQQTDLPLVGPYSGAGSSRWANLYPVKAGYDDEVRRILRMTASLGINRIALFHGLDTLGKTASSVVDQALKGSATRAVARVAFHPATNIRVAAAGLAEHQPQAVILAAPTIASAQLVRELQPMLPGTQFFALSSVNHQTLLEFLGPRVAQGIAVTALSPSPYNPVTPLARDYVRQLKQFRDEAVSYASIDGYIAARVLVEGLKTGSRSGNYNAAFAGLRQLDLGGHVVEFRPQGGSVSKFVDLLVFSQQGRLMN